MPPQLGHLVALLSHTLALQGAHLVRLCWGPWMSVPGSWPAALSYPGLHDKPECSSYPAGTMAWRSVEGVQIQGILVFSSPPRRILEKIFIYFKNCGKIYTTCSFPGVAVVKNLPANEGDPRDVGSIPGSGRSSEVGNGNLLQWCILESSMGRGAWEATVHRATESRT